jgi:hypothetical protein
MEIEKIEFDDTEILRSLDKIAAALSDIAQSGKEVGSTLDSSMGEATAAIDETTNATLKQADALAKQKASVEAANKNLVTWGLLLKEGIKSMTIGGKTLGEWRGQLSQAQNLMKTLTATTQNMTIVQKAFNLVVRAMPLLLLIGAITAVVAWFGRFQKITEAVRGTMAAFSAVMDVVAKRAVMLGDALIKVFSGDFAGAAKSAAGAVSGLGDAMAEAAQRAIELERRTYALQKAQIESAMITARQQAAIEQYQKTAEDETLSAIEREQARQQAMQLSNDMAARREKLAKENLDIAQNELLVEQKKLETLIRSGASEAEIIAQRAKAREEEANFGIEGRERLRDAEIELFDVQKENEAALQELQKIGREIQEKRREDARKAREEELKSLEQINKLLKENRLLLTDDEQARALAAVNQKFDEQVQKTAAAAKVFEDLKKRRGLTPEELAKQAELSEQLVSLEEARTSALVDVLLDYAEKESEIENNRRRKTQTQTREAALQEIADAQKLGDLQIDGLEAIRDRYLAVLKSRGASEKDLQREQEEFDKTIQRARLQNQLQFLERSLELTDAADGAAVEQLKQQIQNIKTELATLDIQDGGQRKTIWDLLGVTNEDEKQAALAAIGQAQDALKSLAQTRIADAEAAVEAAEKVVSSREEALEKEKELQEKGLANNVALREKELQAAKLQQEKALKEQTKARRAAILLDSAEQVSNLITASTKIYKSLAGLGPLGIGLAVATIGLMFGSFFKAKSQALKAAEVPKLRKGRKITGKTHEQGGEHITDSAGNLYEVEKDEWVIGTAHSREHDDFLGDLNSGEYRGVDLSTMARRHAREYRNPVSAMIPGIEFAQAQRREAEHAMQFGVMRAAYMEGSNRIVEAINAKPVVMPFKNGYRRETVKGNTKTIETVLPE